MADQAGTAAPAGAPSGATQTETGATTPGKTGAASDAPAGFDPKAFADGLVKSITEVNKKSWDQIVSRTDHRLAEFEKRQRQARARQAENDDDDGFTPGDPEPAPRSERRPTARGEDEQDHDRDIRDAVLGFRQENENWRDVLPQILEIGNDPDRARAFRVADSLGRVDYAASFERIRDHLELQASRAQQTEANKASQKKEQDRLKRDATISGSGASDTGEEVDLSKMTKKQKLQWLYENNPEMFDPNDLPSDLRKKR